MEKKITNLEVQGFLSDFTLKSKTYILEEGKEKDELEKIAEARGIIIKGSRDLAIFKTIWGFTDIKNDNNAILPSKELLKVLPQIVGKPINKNHDRQAVLGHYIDYRYKQKDNSIIAYGIFYKSNFGDEFEEAKKLFKEKKLGSSFEIWASPENRKYLDDGSYELHDMEIAGGALIFMDEENTPAFPDAKILAFSKKMEQERPELVFAKKYHENEIITCTSGECKLEKGESFNCTCIKCGHATTSTSHCKNLKCPKCGGQMRRAERPGPGENSQEGSKIKCSNCSEEFEYAGIGEIKCPKCFAILDKSGTMQYPPQIMDFKMLCPSCKTNSWLILSKTDDNVKTRCLNCSKEYNLTYAKAKVNKALDEMGFVYTGSVPCYQCGKMIEFSGVSNLKDRTLECKYCGLQFSYSISEERFKKIAKIDEVSIKKIESNKEEGNMEKVEKKVKVSAEKVEVKVEKASEEKKVEAKVEEVKVEEAKEVKAEATAEPVKEEAKTEEVKEATPEVTTEVTTEVKLPEEAKEEIELAKYRSAVKKAVKRLMAVKKELKTAKAERETSDTKLKDGIRKVAKQLIEAKEQVKLYKESAQKILSRRAELGENSLTDEDILNEDKFERAKAEKENILLKASLSKGNEVLGVTKKDGDYYSKKRAEIDGKIDGKIAR